MVEKTNASYLALATEYACKRELFAKSKILPIFGMLHIKVYHMDLTLASLNFNMFELCSKI